MIVLTNESEFIVARDKMKAMGFTNPHLINELLTQFQNHAINESQEFQGSRSLALLLCAMVLWLGGRRRRGVQWRG